MRKIKFRGKRLDSGEWENGYLLVHNDGFGDGRGQCAILSGNAEFSLMTTLKFGYRNVGCETVGQYTGVNDTSKHHKGIYEDDIVLCNDEHVGVVGYVAYDDYPAFDVDFGKHQYGSDECNNISYFKATGSIEVIGNIHDNPELLCKEE